MADALADENYQVSARLRYAGPNVLMYIDTAFDAETPQENIERAAQDFEQRIYPRSQELFGRERSPGVDGDPRLTILNTDVRGAGGYFSSADGVTTQVNRFSNQRDMFVISAGADWIGTPDYSATLAHEFQHMIEWNVARRSPSWFNEGLSTLSEDLFGYVGQSTAELHLAEPDIQLTAWAADSATTGRHYGTSNLFMRYIHEHYGGDAVLSELIQLDAGNDTSAFVAVAQRTRADIDSFDDIVADWAVANTLNDSAVGDGRFAYALLPSTIEPAEAGASAAADVAQYGADYLQLPRGPTALRFDGADTVPLVGALPADGRYAWWSNAGDDSIQTLTRAFDLRSLQQATLQLSLWHEIELNYDYGYAAVSTDDGATWTTLAGGTTTTEDPQGANLGAGLTGLSGVPEADIQQGERGRWIEEQLDLTPFVGQEILLRFLMVSDAAVSGAGMMIDNIRIPELNYVDGVEQGDSGWQANGFARVDGELPQQWALRLIRQGPGGTSVEPLPVDSQGRTGLVLREGERGVLVVMGATPFTRERASYTYQVEQR
ncbi:MAG: immune inhibitor A [Roseiflexaceae bacterium]|nr:immune inhibitor A [Roseiflexaceae bacterium]